MWVQRTLFNTTDATGGDGPNTGRFQILPDRVRIVVRVSGQTGRFGLAQQGQRCGAICGLTVGEVNAHEHSPSIVQRMKLDARSAARPVGCLGTVFWAAPGACWWARTMVLSINPSPKCASPASSANTACHTCARDPLAQRWYSRFRAAKSCGRSRRATGLSSPERGLEEQPVVCCRSLQRRDLVWPARTPRRTWSQCVKPATPAATWGPTRATSTASANSIWAKRDGACIFTATRKPASRGRHGADRRQEAALTRADTRDATPELQGRPIQLSAPVLDHESEPSATLAPLMGRAARKQPVIAGLG